MLRELSGQYDILSATHTVLVGHEFQEFEPYDDAPQEAEFDWGGLIGNVLAGLAVVAVVAVACTGIGAVVVAAGAMASATATGMVVGAVFGGVAAVGACAISDIVSGEVSDTSHYTFHALTGAITGAVQGIIGVKFPGANQQDVDFIADLAIGFTTDVAAQMYNGAGLDDIDWGRAFLCGVSDALLGKLLFVGGEKLLKSKAIQNVIEKLGNAPAVISQKLRQAKGKINEFIEETASKLKKTLKDMNEAAAKQTGKVPKSDNSTGPYAYLEDGPTVGAGKNFTAAQKQKMLEENMKRNGGVVKSDNPNDYFDVLTKPKKSMKGVTPDPNEWQFDHIIPKDKGGTNSYSNCQIVSRKYNREKWNK